MTLKLCEFNKSESKHIRNKPFKGPSLTTSNEYSQYITRLLCSDPDSSFARSFQERNLTSRRQKHSRSTTNFIQVSFKENPRKLPVLFDSNFDTDNSFRRNSL